MGGEGGEKLGWSSRVGVVGECGGGGGGGEWNIIGNSHLVRLHVHICVLHVQR